MEGSENGIRIYVEIKHIRNLAKSVKAHPFPLGKAPHTLRELIEESVRTCIQAYRRREDGANHPSPLTDEQWDEMKEIGKFAFGVHYNNREVVEAKAVETAIEAFEDGLVRIFKGTSELTELDGGIDVSDGDTFTFVRLTMLTGLLW